MSYEPEPDDWVLVRLRKNGRMGALRAKMVARVGDVGGVPGGSNKYTLILPWGRGAKRGCRVQIRGSEAEFEKIESPDEVEF